MRDADEQAAAATVYARGRRWTQEEWDAEECRLDAPAERDIWLSHDHYDSSFADRTGRQAQSVRRAEAPVGVQWGTYWKTTKTHDGCTVWLWGGRHPDDIAEAHRVVRDTGKPFEAALRDLPNPDLLDAPADIREVPGGRS